MRIPAIGTVVLLLLALLTWLLLRGIDTNAAAYATTLRTFDELELAEAALRRDVLQARAGLLRHYDGIVGSLRDLEDAAVKLRSFAAAERLEPGSLDRLATLLRRQEDLTERFKSDNALLQNSLSYVGLLSSMPAFGMNEPELAQETGALAAAVLYLTRDTSAAAVAALQQRIDQFAARAPHAGESAEAARALLAHARLLLQLLPVVDETLKAMIALPSTQALGEVRSLFGERHAEVESTARSFRILLYLVALALLVMLAFLGTRLRARERDRARLTLRLERARRMQMVGSLASGVAHNFNNIISAILGHAEMLEPQLARGTRPAQHVDEMRKAAERARDLVDSILAFGRQRDASVQVVPVKALFADTASLLRASLPGGVELVVADVPADIAVRGEPSRLQQVILNLCNNAAQAMQGRGQVHLTAEPVEVTDQLVLTHGQLAPSRYVRIAVTDTGRGFDESVARRLFEPFFTTRAAGTGLGLATVREIVEDHDGAMDVHSVPGEGSRFEAWLPVVAAVAPGAPVSREKTLGHGEAVLLLESEREQLLRGEEMLAALGYEPVGFAGLDAAIEACRIAPDRFDALIVCHSSLTRGIAESARVLRAVAAHQPVLLASPSSNGIGAELMARAGFAGLVSRPLVSAEVAAALSRCLHHGAR